MNSNISTGSRGVLYLLIGSMIATASLAACAGDSSSPDDSGVQFTVDETMEPRVASVAGFDGATPRPVAAVSDDESQVEFVEREVLVSVPDRAAAQAVADRWNGEILTQMTPETLPEGVDHLFVIYLEDLPEETTILERKVLEYGEDIDEKITTSTLEGLQTLAAAATEADEYGTVASPNWLLIPQTLLDGQSREDAEGVSAGAASYDPEATGWPYLSRHDEPKTGVEAAWQMVEAYSLRTAGRSLPKTALMIIDGGFIDTRDMPENTEIYPFGSWKKENPIDCSGGNPCPWHGARVASAAFAVPDNGFGTAGVASQTSIPILVQTPATDFGTIVKFIFVTIPRLSASFALGSQNTIINLSGGAGIPGAVCLTGICRVADKITAAANRFDILIVASAGNEGKDVDKEKCVGVCWEETKYIPCELGGVLCVGGLAWNDIERHPDSNWGSDGNLDIYGPFQMWLPRIGTGATGEEPPGTSVAASGTMLGVELGSGTSYSSPFVAGVASLVWSSRPSLSPQGVVRVLKRTARGAGPLAGELRVDAMAAVKSLIGPFDPVVEILSPADGDSFEQIVETVIFEGIIADPDDTVAPDIEWRSDIDGVLGFGPNAQQSRLALGTHTITLTGTGRDGAAASKSIQIEITNSPPTVQILPADGSHVVPRGEFLQFEASVTDPNVEGEFPDESLSWTVDGDGTDFVDQTGRVALLDTVRLSIGEHTVRVEANDGDKVASDEVLIEVTAPTGGNQRPTAYMVSPREGDEFRADKFAAGSSFARVQLCGWGIDPDGPDIKGPDVVWFARRVAGGEWRQVATNGEGEDCTSADLVLESGSNRTDYEIRLLVTDAEGASSSVVPRRTISVIVNLI